MAQPAGSKGPSNLPPTATAVPVADTKILRKFGKYEIQKQIGAGGMGAVFLAVDSILKRSVALKILPQDKAANPVLVKRFKSEAQAAANLRHENIVMVYEAGEADGLLYIALEYVEGTDASNVVQTRGMMPVKRTIEIVRQMALALEHAQSQGIVHRDIKPANILIRRDGVAKLADMGLARAVDENADTSITRTGTTVGTIDYMPPEQARNSKSADVRSDIYSLGCTWYFMLTGEPPFPTGSMTDKLRCHAQVPLPDPRAINPAVPESVVAVIRRMTEKEPARRYQTPRELIADLEMAQHSSQVVSEAILGDMDDSASAPRTRKPGRKRAGGDSRKPSAATVRPTGPGWKPPREEQDEEEQPRSELARAVMFYSVVVLLVGGFVGGLGWLVMQFGRAVLPPNQGGANPFPNAAAVVKPVQVAPGPHAAAGGGQPADPGVGGSGAPPDTLIVGTSLTPQAGQGTEGPQPRGGAPSADAAEVRRKREDSLLPPWATKPNAPPELPRLIVRRGTTANGRFASLNAALQQVTPAGAVIVLEGRGPFPLHPVQITGRKRIIIQSEEGPDSREPPVVALVPSVGAHPQGVIGCIGTSLELQRLHLVLADAHRNAGDALLHVAGSDLTLRNCSLTVTGVDAPPLAAICLTAGGDSGADAAPARVLIDRSVIRGNNLSALRVESPRVELVVRRSLLWGGKAPALDFAGPATQPSDKRVVRLVSTTVGSACAVQVGGDPAKPIPTAFEWVDSIVTAAPGGFDAGLFRLSVWTAVQQQGATGAALTWKSADSVYPGWRALLTLEPGNVVVASSPAEWGDVWKDRSAAIPGPIPESLWPNFPGADIVSVEPGRFAPETLGPQSVKTAEGSWPGCAPEMLAVGALPAFEAVRGAADRPPLPAAFGDGFAPSETFRVDVTKEDLGKAIAARTLRPGTEIVAAGFGHRTTSPIVIDNVSVRLTAEQTEGRPPLVLAPKPNDAGDDALITVNQGSLELSGMALGAPASERATGPRWYVRVIGGDLTLRNCRIQGALGGTRNRGGLIQWVRGEGSSAARLFPDSFEGCAAIDNCFLAGSGSLIEADLRRRGMFIRDSVLVSRDDLLSLNLKGEDSQIAGALDIETTTLSAGGSFVEITAAPLAAPTDSPLAIFADRCVFGPPLSAGARKVSPTLLTWIGPLLEQRQVSWWEHGCGYAPEVTCFLRDKSLAVEPQDFYSRWVGQWGANRVVEPLTGEGGVVLNKDLPQRPEERARLEPTDLALSPTSKSAAWGDGPIGAPVSSLGIPPIRGTSAPASPANKARPKPVQTPRTKPEF